MTALETFRPYLLHAAVVSFKVATTNISHDHLRFSPTPRPITRGVYPRPQRWKKPSHRREVLELFGKAHTDGHRVQQVHVGLPARKGKRRPLTPPSKKNNWNFELASHQATHG